MTIRSFMGQPYWKNGDLLCTKCMQYKSANQFGNAPEGRNKGRGGKFSHCHQCNRAYKKAYWKECKDFANERRRIQRSGVIEIECACGCGKTFQTTNHGKLYYDKMHKSKHNSATRDRDADAKKINAKRKKETKRAFNSKKSWQPHEDEILKKIAISSINNKANDYGMLAKELGRTSSAIANRVASFRKFYREFGTTYGEAITAARQKAKIVDGVLDERLFKHIPDRMSKPEAITYYQDKLERVWKGAA